MGGCLDLHFVFIHVHGGNPMKTVILAGGMGTRLAEETDNHPKPVVEIVFQPMIYDCQFSWKCLTYQYGSIPLNFLDHAGI